MKLRAGTVLQNGRYIIQSVLGEGSFGITYRATQTDVNLPVVIKTLHHRLRHQPGFEPLKQQFQKLALYLHKSEHPHLVRVFQSFEEQHYICMVMEYIRGQTLAEIVQTGQPLSPSQALGYIQQIASGLQELHQQGFLHGDLAPRNIIRQYGSNSVILTDFSLSSEFTAFGNQTHSGVVSTGYAAIEQYLPHLKCTPATDIYALSATFYYLLTGQRPVAAPLRECMPLRDRWQQLPSQCSPSLSTVLHQGLELDAQRRPQSVQEWLALLQTEKPVILQTAPHPVASVAETPTQPKPAILVTPELIPPKPASLRIVSGSQKQKMLPPPKPLPALPAPRPIAGDSHPKPQIPPPPPPALHKPSAKHQAQKRKKKLALREARIHRAERVRQQSTQAVVSPMQPTSAPVDVPVAPVNSPAEPVKLNLANLQVEPASVPMEVSVSSPNTQAESLPLQPEDRQNESNPAATPASEDKPRKRWLPLTFTLTATTAAIAGASAGLALRMGVTPPQNLQLFHREQSFPPLKNWPGKNLPAVLTESPLKKNYQSPSYPNFTQPFLNPNSSDPQTQPPSESGADSKAIRPAIKPTSQHSLEIPSSRLTTEKQWKNP
jgi:serine/threonine protein kinase